MAVDGEGRFVRQSGGRGHHGHIRIRIEPNKKGKGIHITNDAPEDEIPAKYITAADKGIRIALEGETVVGGQVVDERCIDDVRVHVTGGSFDPVDSSELAFELAGIFAVKDALKKTKPVKIG
jgi:elongation factor G